MNKNDTELRQLMQRMRVSYLDGLGARIDQLRQFAEILREEKATPEHYQDLRKEIHGLIGSGTTYGFPKITEQGKVFHEMLHTIAPAHQKLVADYIDSLIHSCDKILIDERSTDEST
ncbi:MAG: hypothetical protein EYC62_05525 [Alphaproteobacteria bacterium]|nr:MAG: hypothetical protein EYC62_05525 [Alphaproteobacteria bacterium]